MDMKKLLLYLSFLPLLMVSCKVGESQKEEDSETQKSDVVELTDHQMNTIGLKVGKMEKIPLGAAIHATGKLELSPQDKADVTSLVCGQARRILVKEGQRVNAGQLVDEEEASQCISIPFCQAFYQ